jgi:hypothetical protein
MRKLLTTLAICAMMAVMTSCGGHENTPQGLAKAAVELIADEDYKGYMELTDATKEQKEAMAAMLQKVGQEAQKKGGMEKYEIIDENIDEEKGQATVNVKITYKDGSEETNNMKMVKKDGQWLLSAAK